MFEEHRFSIGSADQVLRLARIIVEIKELLGVIAFREGNILMMFSTNQTALHLQVGRIRVEFGYEKGATRFFGMFDEWTETDPGYVRT